MRLHLRPLGVSQNESVHPKLESQPSPDENPESQQTLEREDERASFMLTKKEFEAYFDGQKMHDASQMTQQMLRRSGEQIAKSMALLQHKVPNIWRPEPQE
jgi:hypothetical protein